VLPLTLPKLSIFQDPHGAGKTLFPVEKMTGTNCACMRAEPQISHLPVQSTQKDLRVSADYCTPRVTSLGKNGISSEQRLQRYFKRVREILQTSPFFDIFIASETTHRSLHIVPLGHLKNSFQRQEKNIL
jgi:hypothetical protein